MYEKEAGSAESHANQRRTDRAVGKCRVVGFLYFKLLQVAAAFHPRSAFSVEIFDALIAVFYFYYSEFEFC